MIIGGSFGYRLLRWISPNATRGGCRESVYQERNKLEALLGEKVWKQVSSKSVIDFGCGIGKEAIEIAKRGAERVIGIDIREDLLKLARASAAQTGVANRCTFSKTITEKADVIISLDAFEHFQDPDEVLRVMGRSLLPGGHVFISFGPPWLHPLGGHLFSVFPWAHLIFTEKALIRWRSEFKTDGAKRFCEVEGGLNQMTIRRFEKLVQASEFRFVAFEAVPIRKTRYFHNFLTREILTAIVRCELVLKATSSC